MIYVEFLRVRRVFAGFAIASLVVVVLVVIVRLFGHTAHDTSASISVKSFVIASISATPTPARAAKAPAPPKHRSESVPVVAIGLAAAALLGTIAASILANAFVKQSAHLDIAFLRPVARRRTALSIVLVDVAAIVAVELLTVATVAAVFAISGIFDLRFDEFALAASAVAVSSALAWYALLLVVSSRAREYGAVIGFAWPVALGLPVLADWLVAKPGVYAGVGRALAVVSLFEPFGAVRSLSSGSGGRSIEFAGFGNSMPIASAWLFALAAVYIVVAITRWRRGEA